MQLSADIERASKAQLDGCFKDVTAALGTISDDEAQALYKRIDERRRYVPQPKVKKRGGGRRRTPASKARSRRWVAPKDVPAPFCDQFSTGEIATLSVMALAVVQSGVCDLPIGKIASLAGVGRTTVQNAFRLAVKLGMIHVQQRRIHRFRNQTNVVTIVSKVWLSWLRITPPKGGFKGLNGTSTVFNNKGKTVATAPKQGQANGSMAPLSPRWARLAEAKGQPNAQKQHQTTKAA